MHQRWVVLAIASGLFFLSQFYRSANAVIAAHLLNDLHLDTAGLGALSAAFFYAFAFTQIPLSIWIDTIGAKKIMTVLSLAGLGGAFLFPLADNMVLGMASRILLGVGMACNMIGTLKLVALRFHARHFGALTGVVFAVGYAGNLTAASPLAWLVQRIGWRPAFQIAAFFYLFLWIVFTAAVKEKNPAKGMHSESVAEKPKRALFTDLGRLFKNRDYWIISLATAVSYGIFAAFQTLWAGPYLTEALHFSVIGAGNLILFLNLGLILGGPGWGFLSDRVFKTRKWAVFGGQCLLLLIFICFIFLPMTVGPGLLILLFLFFGLCRSSGMLMYPHIKELMPAAMAGTAMTGINFFTMLGPALLLQGIGSLMQALYPLHSRGPEAFRAAFLLCAGCLLIVIVLYGFTKDSKEFYKKGR